MTGALASAAAIGALTAVVGAGVGVAVRAADGVGVETEVAVLALPDADRDEAGGAAVGLLMVTLVQDASATNPIGSATPTNFFGT